MMPLEGRNILITGSAKRIGRSIATRLFREGARVAIHYSGSEAEARATAAQCGGAPVFRADLERVSEIERLFGEVESHFGSLHALVNNAARFTEIDPLEVSEADWDFVHSVNLKAVFFCCQQAARRMKAGRIVNISSLGGIRPWARHAHYCASKAGVIMLTKALAKAWAPHIAVNSVAPGVIPFEEAGEERIREMVRMTPAERAGSGDEIADAVAYFLTTNAFTTGQILAVDGGLSLR